ncbi:MAG: molybdopterin-containing oxidoreductase family protein [Desulforhopalus sp.]
MQNIYVRRKNRSTMIPTNQLETAKIPGSRTGIEIKKTICAICEGGSTSCGVNAYVKNGQIIKVEGMKEFPHNRGTLCAKGNGARQYIYNRDRILAPLKRTGPRGSSQFEEIGWDEAYATLEDRLLAIKAESGPESVVFGVGYTKWLRPFVQRLAISFGTPNFATESSTCHFATQMAAKLTYGAWGGPDIKNSECLMVWTKNLFSSATPGARKLLEAIKNGLKIIEVNPTTTHLSRYADLRLHLRPGTDGALALGMAQVIIEEHLYDQKFVADWSEGFDQFKAYVKRFSPEDAAKITGVPADLIRRAARLFAASQGSSIMTSASPTVHHTNGVQNHRAIICLSGLTGNYDAPGGNHVVPETWLHVGCAAQTRHRKFTFPRDLKNMAPRVGGDKFPLWTELVNEAQSMHLPFQIESGHPYPIRALVAFGYNQRMWPGNDLLLNTLKKLDFFADIDLFMTDTARMADIILPACSSYERSELRFYSCNHVIYTQPAIRPLGQSKPDNEIIFELAKKIAPDDKLMQQGYEACIDWILQPTGLTVEELKKHPAGFSLINTQMPGYYKYREEGFDTPSAKMEFTSRQLQEAGYDALPVYYEPVLSPRSTPEIFKKYPLVLGTGTRLPMYIHSRTFRNSWNRSLHPVPTVSVNPEDAAARDIAMDDEVLLTTPRNSIKVKALITDTIPPGVVNIYHGWPEIEVNQLISPEYLDPISGFPGFKSLLCEIKKHENRDKDHAETSRY